MKSQLSLIKHKAISLGLSALMCLGVFAPFSRAEAGVDPWVAASQALGVYAAYKSSLRAILTIGNDPAYQVSSRLQDLKANGKDWTRMDLTFSANGRSDDFIGDGSNYTDLYLY